MSERVIEGSQLPAFVLPDQEGREVDMGTLIGKKPIVIFFYPMDETPGCIMEVKKFRDSHEEFEALGAEVFGISGDSVKSHDNFHCHYELNFQLLSDKGNKVRKLFGVPRGMLGLLPGRVTYVINQSGKVISVYEAMSGKEHHTHALEALKASAAVEQ